MRCLILTIILLVFVPFGRATAEVNGFIAIGAADADSNNFLGNDGNALLIDASLNTRFSLMNGLFFNGQLSYRKVGDNIKDNGVEIDYLNLSYVTTSLLPGEQHFSVGRVKTKFGLYNEVRSIASARPSILLPQGTYLDVFRDIFLSIDGVSFENIFFTSSGDIEFYLSAGEIRLDDQFKLNTFGDGTSGQWEEDSAFVADIKWYYNDWLFSLTRSNIKPKYAAAPGDQLIISPAFPVLPILDGQVDLTSTIASVQKTFGNFELSAEYLYRSYGVEGLVPTEAQDENPMEAFYFQARYFLNENVTIMGRYEEFYLDADDKSGRESLSLGLPSWAQKSKTTTVGIKWQPTSRVIVFAEAHYIRGSGFYPPIGFAVPDALEKESTTLLATQLVYKF